MSNEQAVIDLISGEEAERFGDAPAAETPRETPSRRRFRAIHRLLRRRIAMLDYPPGQRLDIDRLAAELNVSRTPIRSVLQQMEFEGLVSTLHGVGTTVTAIDTAHLREAVDLRTRLAELIGVLSPLAPSSEAIGWLRTARQACDGLYEDRDIRKFAAIDMRLHDAVCTVIGNSLLLKTYDDLYYRTARMWFYFLPKLDWHQEIAIFASDIDQTRSAMIRGDTRAVGFLVRNAVSAAVIRLDDLIAQAETDTLELG